VLVDGAVKPKSHRLEGGEELEVELYEDEHLIVVDKPAGVVVHPAAGHASGTLVHGLVGRAAGGDEEDRPGIVHRLDRDTSGLLVVARSDEAFERLQDMVRERALDRRYVALVRGRPRSWRGTIDAPIGRDRDEPTRRSLDTDAPRDAVTHFEVAELIPGHALLDVRLETGRTHQIRVHLAAVGLPVVGDPVYGVSDHALGRQFLHAGRLGFDHPFTGERLEIESPLPPDLDAYLSRLRGSG
jgi:23S rRNA pseudouridine1911/1915/1917 synthase